MVAISRRTACFGALTAAATSAPAPAPASAALQTNLARHPGFRAWTAPSRAVSLPLDEMVETETGPRRLVEWLDRRPAAIAIWATWCAPCLIEKPHQAALAERLTGVGAATRMLALQAYDDAGISFARGRALLDRLGAEALPGARAMPETEEGIARVFGGARRDRSRTTLPLMLLIGGDGLEIGRAVGVMTGVDGQTDYWQDEATFDFLSRLV